MLQIGDLHSSDVGIASVDILLDEQTLERTACSRQRTRGVNWVGQLLVKKPRLNHTVRLQVMFIEHVVVIGMFRFQVRISNLYREWIRRLIHYREWNQVERIRSRQTPAVNGANVGIRRQVVTELHARQRIALALFGNLRRGAEPIAGVGTARDSKHLKSLNAQLRRLQPQSRL